MILIMLLTLLLLAPFGIEGRASTELNHTWDFLDVNEYNRNPRYVEIAGGSAQLAPLPLEEGWRTKQYQWPSGIACGEGVAYDSNGDIGTTGTFLSDVSEDIWVRKFESDTGRLLWSKTFDGGSEDSGRDICSDPSGDFIAAGYSYRGYPTGWDDAWVGKYRGSDGYPCGPIPTTWISTTVPTVSPATGRATYS